MVGGRRFGGAAAGPSCTTTTTADIAPWARPLSYGHFPSTPRRSSIRHYDVDRLDRPIHEYQLSHDMSSASGTHRSPDTPGGLTLGPDDILGVEYAITREEWEPQRRSL